MAKFMTPQLAVVTLARKVLAAQSRWIEGSWAVTKKLTEREGEQFFEKARNKSSNFAKANDPKACAWCAEGAVMKAAGDLGHDAKFAKACIKAVNDFIPDTTIQDINDGDGHKATVAALDDVIAKMKKAANVGVAC